MSKKWRILIVIIWVILFWICIYYCCVNTYYNTEWCDDFKRECRIRAAWNYDWSIWMIEDINAFYDSYCPDECSQYTEELWYFKDKEEQAKYYREQVKKCEEYIIECRERNSSNPQVCPDVCDERWIWIWWAEMN